jgi:signal transduction histidine kinase
MPEVRLNPDLLGNSPFLAVLPPEQLGWLARNADPLNLEPGVTIITENVPQDAFYIVLDGEFEVTRQAGDEQVVLAVQGRGQILGETSVIADVLPNATVRSTCPSRLLRISRQVFNQLILNNPQTALELLRIGMQRLRNTEVMLNQREKLASLGTLAAGLAHELNNPAAAARRSAGQLRQTINAWLNSRAGVDALNLEPRLNEIVLERLRQDNAQHDHDKPPLDTLERSDLESEIEAWLEAHGMDEPWEYAPAFVEFGWQATDLEAWCQDFAPAQVPVILRWLATGYIVHTLLDEILNSSERISEIVAAVKSYAYLDEAPRKEIDIHSGLESTLVILKHKLKQGVKVERHYAPDLSPLEAFASELNQVWTNLIDNAIDAMGGEGTLRLRTCQEGDYVVVEIGDDGPGINERALPRLFEPFFTTKDPGKGTGLGLHVSYNIIQKHRGKIEVFSQPGDTRFKVSLPVRSNQGG